MTRVHAIHGTIVSIPVRHRIVSSVRDTDRVINVLVEGTSYLDMFDPSAHCLFGRGDLPRRFEGWEILRGERQEFPAPHGTVKSFGTSWPSRIICATQKARVETPGAIETDMVL